MSIAAADIPIPEGLSEVERAEFLAYKSALIEYENEFNQLFEGKNPEHQTCLAIINEIKEKRIAQADERLKMKLEIIDKQREREKDKINQERIEYNKQLFERILRSYYQAYQSITAQLKELLGKDYPQFIAEHLIEFPTIPSETQMRTRMEQSEEAKVKISPSEAENDYRRIQQILAEAATFQ